MTTNEVSTNQIMVKMIMDRWNASIKSCDSLLGSLTDEELQKEIAPGKNRGIYLLGHLIAVHDDMMILLGFGDKLYPELYEPFIKSPDKAVSNIPSAKELRDFWAKQNEVLTQKLATVSDDEWFTKHNSVSAEDFVNEPHRNKLNIMITRTSHLAYHTGQLVLIK